MQIKSDEDSAFEYTTDDEEDCKASPPVVKSEDDVLSGYTTDEEGRSSLDCGTACPESCTSINVDEHSTQLIKFESKCHLDVAARPAKKAGTVQSEDAAEDSAASNDGAPSPDPVDTSYKNAQKGGAAPPVSESTAKDSAASQVPAPAGHSTQLIRLESMSHPESNQNAKEAGMAQVNEDAAEDSAVSDERVSSPESVDTSNKNAKTAGAATQATESTAKDSAASKAPSPGRKRKSALKKKSVGQRAQKKVCSHVYRYIQFSGGRHLVRVSSSGRTLRSTATYRDIDQDYFGPLRTFWDGPDEWWEEKYRAKVIKALRGLEL